MTLLSFSGLRFFCLLLSSPGFRFICFPLLSSSFLFFLSSLVLDFDCSFHSFIVLQHTSIYPLFINPFPTPQSSSLHIPERFLFLHRCQLGCFYPSLFAVNLTYHLHVLHIQQTIRVDA